MTPQKVLSPSLSAPWIHRKYQGAVVPRGVDLWIGVALQRRVIEPDAENDKDECRYPEPHQLAGEHVRDEVDAPVQRDALGAVLAGVLGAWRQAVAVDDDLVIVHAGEDEQQHWQQQHMRHVEAQQAVGAHLRAATYQQVDLLADQRRGLGHAGADGDRPQCQLVPGQQVTGEAEEAGKNEQQHAGKPGELAWLLVAGGIESAQHMQENDEHHRLRAQAVQIAHELAKGHVVQHAEHVAVGDLRRGRVPEHQNDAGDRLEEDEVGGEPAETK